MQASRYLFAMKRWVVLRKKHKKLIFGSMLHTLVHTADNFAINGEAIQIGIKATLGSLHEMLATSGRLLHVHWCPGFL